MLHIRAYPVFGLLNKSVSNASSETVITVTDLETLLSTILALVKLQWWIILDTAYDWNHPN